MVSGDKMAFDPNLDENKFSETIEFEGSNVIVGVFSYNEGEKKMQISRAIEAEILLNPDLKITSPWKPFVFDKEGNLTDIV